MLGRSLFYRFVIVMVPLASFSCATWEPQDPPLVPHLTTAPDQIRLTLADGRVVETSRAIVRGDSVLWSVPSEEGAPSVVQGVPMGQIVELEFRRVSVKRTATVIGLASGAAFGTMLLICLVGACN